MPEEINPETNTQKEENPVNPLDERDDPKSGESELIKNIVSTETSQGEENILGDAPQIDSSLLMETAPKKSLLLFFVKTFFSILFFSSLISFGFFNSQLTSRFDFLTANIGLPNPMKDLTANNIEAIKLQTDINLYNFLQIKSFLDKFSFYGDTFIRNYDIVNSPTTSNMEREKARSNLSTLRTNLESSFINARDLIAKPIYVPLISLEYPDDESLIALFEENLKAELNDRASSLSGRDNQSENRRDYKNYINTLRLVGNRKLKGLLVRTDFEALNNAEVYSLIKEVNSLIVNDMSVIQEINSQRIRWADIINEIEQRTREIDLHYSKDFFDTVGGIRYTSFDFDANNRRISISGETKTINTTTFTRIADLIDKLNSSNMFKNGEMRSFSKAGSLEDGYTGSLRLSLDLEGDTILTQEEDE